MTPIEKYIAATPSAYQPALNSLRTTILTSLPTAAEQLKYQMPTFYWHENVIHFALFKHHIGLYPTASGVAAFATELTPYKTSKGAIQLPLDQPLPLDLVRRITEFRKQEIRQKYQL
ncbi:DUF1801 domain-containing protein [Lactiplantibacillus sp. WILCCON 0030]|uniref:DUF1801 domain-containing protein n=1 Tax=Lactiplantibacillus brownii TaxID=3069269 RepID=A0ABU1A5E7_9LACO|nr:DUF1801 domain-containing protein [Lactiplantibacillus brownii]MDQ7936212.1 DUF1801 domain-containing protein [Lactiplantibacillus brownii]